MKLPEITKDQIFRSIDDDNCQSSFLECFPAMPDPYKDNLMERVLNRWAFFAFSELGLLYYLPLIMSFLIENPRIETNPGFFEDHAESILLKHKGEFPELFQEWKKTRAQLIEIDEAIGSRLYEMSKNYLAEMVGDKLNYRIYGS